jgi:MFS family permease
MVIVVLAQFCGTSLWFTGNAVIPILPEGHDIGWITSAVQLGFIAGTFLFAVLGVSDRFSPSLVFFACSLLGAFANLALIVDGIPVSVLLASRFFTGFFLAGVYPVGMKIAADWSEKGLGVFLGWLVGALVIGTALPHWIRSLELGTSWEMIPFSSSVLAVAGGLSILLFVRNGPYRMQAPKFNPRAAVRAFAQPDFRAAAVGYFGHMWELYAFWAFVPVLFAGSDYSSMLSFTAISMGGAGCVLGGLVSRRMGSAPVAFYSLAASGVCCLISPMLTGLPDVMLMAVVFIWGFFVVSDSPQFSALVAQTVSAEYRGSALTMVTCIGFAITIASIQLLSYVKSESGDQYLFILLLPGPLAGLWGMRGLMRRQSAGSG